MFVKNLGARRSCVHFAKSPISSQTSHDYLDIVHRLFHRRCGKFVSKVFYADSAAAPIDLSRFHFPFQIFHLSFWGAGSRMSENGPMTE
jgi:hypothetical protein